MMWIFWNSVGNTIWGFGAVLISTVVDKQRRKNKQWQSFGAMLISTVVDHDVLFTTTAYGFGAVLISTVVDPPFHRPGRFGAVLISTIVDGPFTGNCEPLVLEQR